MEIQGGGRQWKKRGMRKKGENLNDNSKGLSK